MIPTGFELLDFSGPAAVFSATNSFLGQEVYKICPISAEGGPVSSGANIVVQTEGLSSVRPKRHDTVLVVGSSPENFAHTLRENDFDEWLISVSKNVQRVGSVCSGAFFLARAGLLSGKQAVTHWAGCEHLQKKYPDITVLPDRLYVQDTNVWTSAGVTAGIDMALAMVAEDISAGTTSAVAKMLVVYAHRPGGQSQFSNLLQAQLDASPFSEITQWIHHNLSRAIHVADLAEMAGMTERTFYRKFSKSFGMGPSKYVELVRMERAKQYLEIGHLVKNIYLDVGYSAEAAFRLAFEKRYGISPTLYKQMHRQKS